MLLPHLCSTSQGCPQHLVNTLSTYFSMYMKHTHTLLHHQNTYILINKHKFLFIISMWDLYYYTFHLCNTHMHVYIYVGCTHVRDHIYCFITFFNSLLWILWHVYGKAYKINMLRLENKLPYTAPIKSIKREFWVLQKLPSPQKIIMLNFALIIS